MIKEAVIEILHEVKENYSETETAKALDIAAKCVSFIDSMCNILQTCRDVGDNVDVARAYIEGFKKGAFTK